MTVRMAIKNNKKKTNAGEEVEIRNNGRILGIYIFFSGYILMAEPVEFPSWKERNPGFSV